jgi:hypothetical protein
MSNTKVHGVAAQASDGTETVWVAGAATAISDPPGRPWVTDRAPGVDLVSLAGGMVTDPSLGVIPALVCWSGSSFSTAVASAQFANGDTSANPVYDTVNGLTYVNPATRAIQTVGSSASPVPTNGCR